MPELPEVETIRRGLFECLKEGKAGKVERIKVFERKSFIGEEGEMVGAEVVGLRRRGKALVFDFSNGKSIITHLRMTGQLIFVEGEETEGETGVVGEEELGRRFAGGHPNDNFIARLPNKQTRVEVDFERGKLFFNDQRKFGFFKVVRTEGVEKDSFISRLAKEPWEMTGEELYEKLKRKKSAIKTVILDQEVICGLGNIYADETLFEAGISPTRKAEEVSLEEAEKIVKCARKVMERSLEAGGSTIRNYVKADGTKGDYLELFAKVFNREGKKCERCGGEILKMKVGGRGTHYCRRCQK